MELYSSETVRHQTYGSPAHTLDRDTCLGFQPAWITICIIPSQPVVGILSAGITGR